MIIKGRGRVHAGSRGASSEEALANVGVVIELREHCSRAGA